MADLAAKYDRTRTRPLEWLLGYLLACDHETPLLRDTILFSMDPRLLNFIFFSVARQPYMGLGLLVSSRFHGHTHLRYTTLGRTPLDE
jgi:hypothetical protein